MLFFLTSDPYPYIFCVSKDSQATLRSLDVFLPCSLCSSNLSFNLLSLTQLSTPFLQPLEFSRALLDVALHQVSWNSLEAVGQGIEGRFLLVSLSPSSLPLRHLKSKCPEIMVAYIYLFFGCLRQKDKCHLHDCILVGHMLANKHLMHGSLIGKQ